MTLVITYQRFKQYYYRSVSRIWHKNRELCCLCEWRQQKKTSFKDLSDALTKVDSVGHNVKSLVPAVKRHIKYIRGNNINIKYTREIIYISKIKGVIGYRVKGASSLYIFLAYLMTYSFNVKYSSIYKR
jgi:hypothetical protein